MPAEWDFAFPFEDGLAQRLHRVLRSCTKTVTSTAASEGEPGASSTGEGRVVVPVAHDRESLPSPG